MEKERRIIIYSPESPGPTNFFDPVNNKFLDGTLASQLISRYLLLLKMTGWKSIISATQTIIHKILEFKWPKSCDPNVRAYSSEVFRTLELTLALVNTMLLSTIRGFNTRKKNMCSFLTTPFQALKPNTDYS